MGPVQICFLSLILTLILGPVTALIYQGPEPWLYLHSRLTPDTLDHSYIWFLGHVVISGFWVYLDSGCFSQVGSGSHWTIPGFYLGYILEEEEEEENLPQGFIYKDSTLYNTENIFPVLGAALQK